jgi:hypothetical protein
VFDCDLPLRVNGPFEFEAFVAELAVGLCVTPFRQGLFGSINVGDDPGQQRSRYELGAGVPRSLTNRYSTR